MTMLDRFFSVIILIVFSMILVMDIQRGNTVGVIIDSLVLVLCAIPIIFIEKGK